MKHAISCRYLILFLISLFSLATHLVADETLRQSTGDIKISKLPNGIAFAHLQRMDAIDTKVAIYVKAGHLYNSDTQGMAHLLEHLFNVSDNLDDNSNIEAILNAYGGKRKASTDTTGVVFWYQIGADGTQMLLEKLSAALAKPNVSEQAISSQLAAIENEWLKGQKYQDLIEWEQEFNEFSVPSTSINQSLFFVGNKDSLTNENLKNKILDFHHQHYQSENIRLIISSPFSHQSMIELANTTLGQVTFAHQASKATLDLKFQSKIELFEKPDSKQTNVSLHYALPFDPSISLAHWQYISELLNEKGDGSFADKVKNKYMVTVNSAQLNLNYYENRHRLIVTFQSPLKPTTAAIKLAEKMDASLRGFVDWAVHSPGYTEGFAAFLATAKQRCKGHMFDIDKNTASDLSNPIFFIPLVRAVTPCNISDSVEQKASDFDVINSSPLFVSISAPSLEDSSKHPIKTMPFYARRYQSFAYQPTPAILEKFQFPEKNFWLTHIDKKVSKELSVNWLKNSSEPVAEITLLLPTNPLDHYVKAQWFQTYLEESLQREFRDAKKLGIKIDVVIDDAFRIRVSGEKSLVSTIYTRIVDAIVNISLDKTLFLLAKNRLIQEASGWSDKPQVNRTNEFISRVLNNQTWQDASFMTTLESLTEAQAKEFLDKLPPISKSLSRPRIKLDGQRFSMTSDESVNTLASIRLMNKVDIKSRLYSVVINALFKVEYKNEFRNRQKIAYIAITDVHLSKYGSGLLTLLQTSSQSLDRMKLLNLSFFQEMYKKLQQMNDNELSTTFRTAKTELELKQKQDRYLLENPELDIFTKRQIEESTLNKTELLEFAKTLLFDKQYLAHIEVKGKQVKIVDK